jgi:hypothetical protein
MRMRQWFGSAVVAAGLLLAVGAFAQTPAHPTTPPRTPPTAAATAATPPVASKKGPQPAAVAKPGGGPGLVWVNTDSKAYHCNGSKWYGKTKTGQYMTEPAAKAGGFHPAGNKGCTT